MTNILPSDVVQGGWYARFVADLNDREDDGTVPADLIAYVLPTAIADGQEVTLIDAYEEGLTVRGIFRGWRIGHDSTYRYAAIEMVP